MVHVSLAPLALAVALLTAAAAPLSADAPAVADTPSSSSRAPTRW
jgi:hypothetical protein